MACLKSRKSFKAFLPMRKIFFMLIEFLPCVRGAKEIGINVTLSW